MIDVMHLTLLCATEVARPSAVRFKDPSVVSDVQLIRWFGDAIPTRSAQN